MNLQLISHLESLPKAHLEMHLAAYPWFTAARIVLAKKLRDLAQVQSAAVYVQNRTWFKRYYEAEPVKDIFEEVAKNFVDEAAPNVKKDNVPEAVVESSHSEEPSFPELEVEAFSPTGQTADEKESVKEELTEAVAEETETLNSLQPKSFSDWLQAFSIGIDGKALIPRHQQHAPPENDELEKLIQSNIPYEMLETKLDAETHYAKGLDTFIEQQKEIKKAAVGFPLFDETTRLPVTETFAKLLTAQQKYKQAISIYEKLGLKFPSKSAYFAARIRELREKFN